MQILSAVRAKVSQLAGKVAKYLGDYRVADLEAELEGLNGVFDSYDELLGKYQQQAQGLTTAVGLLKEQYDRLHRDSAVTTACLLTVAGGEVTVCDDTIKAVEASDIAIDYTREGDKVTLKLVVEDEAEAEAGRGGCDEHCGCDETPAQ